MTSARRGQLAVAGCCLVASAAYSGAVTTAALLTYVAPSVVLVAVLSVVLTGAGSVVAGALGCSAVGLSLAQLTNLTGGDSSGPIARSTFLATLGTSLAVSAARRQSPAVVAVPVAGVLAGSLYLGAAGEVLPVLAATMICLVLTLPVLEGARRRNDSPVRRMLLTPLLALAAGAAALGAAGLQDALEDRPPVIFEAAQVDQKIQPPRLRPTPSASPTPTSPPATATPTPSASPPAAAAGRADGGAGDGRVLRLVASVVGLLLWSLLLRLLVVSLGWRRLARRLRRGDDVRATAGAWAWVVLRLRALGVIVPRSLSPDGLAAGEHGLAVSDEVAVPLVATARVVTSAVFSGLPSGEGSRDAWRNARTAAVARRDELPRWRRFVAALRSVPALPPT